MHPEKFRMGTDFVYSVVTTETMNYHDAVEYCQTEHGASLPIFQSSHDANWITIDQEIQRNGK